MLELVASLVVDLSDQNLTVYNSNQEVVRVIPVSTGRPQLRHDLQRQGVPPVPLRTCRRTPSCMAFLTPCVGANEAICIHAAPWRRTLVRLQGPPQQRLRAHAHGPCTMAVPEPPHRHADLDPGLISAPVDPRGDLPRGSREPATPAPGAPSPPGAPPVASARPTASSPLWPAASAADTTRRCDSP